MRFGAGRGSHQIVEVGGEEGRQVPTGDQLLGAFEEVGRLGHEELTLRDEGEGGGSGEAGVQDGDEVELVGLEDMVVDGVAVGVEDKVEVGAVDVGGGIARQGEAEEDSDEVSEMGGAGKQVEEVEGIDGEMGKVQEELVVQEEGDNAEERGGLEDGGGVELVGEGKLARELQQPVGGRAGVMGN